MSSTPFYGGQAVIEGVMMRTPNAYAIAIRKADGTIVNTAAALPKWSEKYPFLKLPILRGGALLIQSMGLGIKALNYSASEAFAEAEDAKAAEVEVALTPAVIEGEGDFAGLTGGVPGLFPLPRKKRAQDELKKGGTAAAASSIVFAVILNVLLFVAAERRGLRFNASPSLPIGIYIVSKATTDLVEFCPPEPFATILGGGNRSGFRNSRGRSASPACRSRLVHAREPAGEDHSLRGGAYDPRLERFAHAHRLARSTLLRLLSSRAGR